MLMPNYKQCEFFLLRYVPDAVKGEFVNIGVALLEPGDGGFTDVRFVRDWRRVRGADPDVDIELLESYEEDLRRLLQSRQPEIINYRGPMSRREWLLAQMEQSFSGALELTPMQALLTESPSAELGILARTYLESPARAARAQTGRRQVYLGMRGAFEAAGVWPFMRQDIPAAQYTRPGDPLKIDCGYRPNGVIHLFQALSLATDVNSAKVLAFSYPEMRDGIANVEHAVSDLTVVTEDQLDLQGPAVAFALATLQESEIAIARVAEMPEIADRARLELKL
jgi:hypothetical protein